jgi:hypothetical protein
VDVYTHDVARTRRHPQAAAIASGSPTPSRIGICVPYSSGRAPPASRRRPYTAATVPRRPCARADRRRLRLPLHQPQRQHLRRRIAVPGGDPETQTNHEKRGLSLAREVLPGASLDLLPPAPLPDDLAYARGDPISPTCSAAPAVAFGAVGRQALPDPVRDLVTARLTALRGEGPGLSRAWADSAIEPLRQHSGHRGGSRCWPRSPPIRSTRKSLPRRARPRPAGD